MLNENLLHIKKENASSVLVGTQHYKAKSVSMDVIFTHLKNPVLCVSALKGPYLIRANIPPSISASGIGIGYRVVKMLCRAWILINE